MLNYLCRKRTIVFDYDGTLVDSNKIKYECFFLSTKKYSNEHNKLKSIINDNANSDRYVVFSKFGKVLEIDNKIIDRLIENYNSMVQQRIIKAKEIPGSSRFIAIAKKKKCVFT